MKRSRNGFSLVGLIVVIAVLGILAALLLPALAGARFEAKKKSCANNLKQVGLAFHMYVMSFGDGRQMPDGTGSGKLVRLYTVTDGLKLLDKKTLLCPATTDENKDAKFAAARSPDAAECSYASLGKEKVVEDDVAAVDKATASDDTEGAANHADGMNVLFGDGHVEFMRGQKDLLEGLTND